jgi:hypothetical protein
MATATQHAAQVGIFDTREGARQALQALHSAGFSDDRLTMVVHHEAHEDPEITDLDADKVALVTRETQEERGLGIGVVIGALIGAAIGIGLAAIPNGLAGLTGTLMSVAGIAGVVAGLIFGAVGGAVVGTVVGMEFPDEEARRCYLGELKIGHALVGVRTDNRVAEAWDILHACGGHELWRDTDMPPTAAGL